MQGLGSVLARVHRRVLGPVLAAAITLSAVVASAPQAAAAAPRPAFASPFTCGQAWFARTYPGHPSFAVDWNLPGSGEADFGQPVLAGGSGVATVTQHRGYGNMVTIDHGGGWQTLYAHLSSFDVATGQRVEPDTVIGRVGSTGRSDGSHLHHEQSLDGVRQPVAVDGSLIVASYSSRAASYQSANCAPAVEAQSRRAGRAAWEPCRATTPRVWSFRCVPAQRRPLP